MEAQQVHEVLVAIFEWTSEASTAAVLAAYFGIGLALLMVIAGAQRLWKGLRTPRGAGHQRLTHDPRDSEVRNRGSRRR